MCIQAVAVWRERGRGEGHVQEEGIYTGKRGGRLGVLPLDPFSGCLLRVDHGRCVREKDRYRFFVMTIIPHQQKRHREKNIRHVLKNMVFALR